jgi:hypothetical protein
MALLVVHLEARPLLLATPYIPHPSYEMNQAFSKEVSTE